MSYYLVSAAVALVLLIVIGVPVITRQVKIPRSLRWQELGEAELSEAAAEVFKEMDGSAGALEFQPVRDFTVPGLARGNQNRLYFSRGEATALVATILTEGGKSKRLLEFSTEFEAGVELCTSNAPFSGLFEQPDWRQVQHLPRLLDLNRLHQAHQQRLKERLSQGQAVRQLRPEQLLDQMVWNQARQIEHQVEKGLLRPDPKGDTYVATYRIALRAIANFINPLADGFSLGRFALGFGAGLALALAAVLLARPLGLEELLHRLWPSAKSGQIIFLLYCPGFVLAGLVAGWQFREKGFLWGFLISLPAVILLPGRVTQPVFYCIVAAQAGLAAGRLRETGEKGPGRAPTNMAFIILVVLIVLGFYYTS
jgi:hypothetical protein